MTNAANKILISLALLLAAWPAQAEPMAGKDAPRHVGETATVRGRATLTFMPSGEIYIDLDGQGEAAPLTGYISRWNRPKFQNLSGLDGRTVELSGQIDTFRAQPEIFLQDPDQLRIR